MDNIQNHGNDKRLEKQKQKLRAAKTVYKDGTKDAPAQQQNHTKTTTAITTKTQQTKQQNPSYDKATKIFQYYNRSTIALSEPR